MSKFQADSLVHSKIPKRKKQGDSRINQLIEFAKATGVHIDNMKSLYAEVVSKVCSKKSSVPENSKQDSARWLLTVRA